MPVSSMQLAMADDDAETVSDLMHSTEETAFLGSNSRTSSWLRFPSNRHHRLCLGVSLLGLSLVAVVVAMLPTGRHSRVRGFQKLWRESAPTGSCRSMGCATDNYVGTCQCNDGCVYFDDCCLDYEETCAVAKSHSSSDLQGTCENLGCGSNSRGCTGLNCANLCDCVPSCREAGNCCPDFETLCPDGSSYGQPAGKASYGQDGDGEAGEPSWQDDGQDGYADEGDSGEQGGYSDRAWGSSADSSQETTVKVETPEREEPPAAEEETTMAEVQTTEAEPERTPEEEETTTLEATTTTEMPPTTTEEELSTEPAKRQPQREDYSNSVGDGDGGSEGSDGKGGSEGSDGEGSEGEGSDGEGSDGEGSEGQSSKGQGSEDEGQDGDGDEDGETTTGDKDSHFKQEQADMIELLKWQQVKACPAQLMNRDIPKGADAGTIPNVPSAAHCQRLCTEKDCDACVWGAARGIQGLSDTCFLKKLTGSPEMVEKQGVIAALPCCRNPQEGESCPKHVLQTDVQTMGGFPPAGGVTSASACQEKCTKTEGCSAWSWGAARNLFGVTDVCFMKKLQPQEQPKLVNKQGIIAGLPCGCRTPTNHALWPQDEETIFAMPQPPAPRPAKAGSCFCTALMRPYSYEADLFVSQFQQKQGIFGCTAYAVYSNQEMLLAEGLITKKVRTSQMCQSGGEFKTALNLRIFAAFWKQVFVDADFQNYNWFVKADADTVFVYQRLPPLLAKYDERASGLDGRGVYFNNCKYGMHGPLEVFSQNAVLALWRLFSPCYYYFRKLCSGDCNWGEDLWCDQCLKRKANATIDRVHMYDLLMEKHCDPPDDWDSCTDRKSVSFHPFKTMDSWQACFDNAM